MCEDLTRRGFLRGSGVAMLGLPLLSTPAFAKKKYKTRHVVLVAFAGGVRSRETIREPANIPNLMRIAEQGVICPNINVMNNGHFGATMSIFTGQYEYLGIRENERGEHPTLFEYTRKGLEIPANMVWLSTSGGAQQRNLVYSSHADYGEKYGANLIDAAGVFNTEFQKVIESFGKPSVPSAAEDDAVASLRKAMNPPPTAPGGLANDPETIDRLQKYILQEIAGKTARITGPGSSDARAIQVAVSVLRIFKPTMLGVILQNADIAHGSYNAYVNVIKRADEQLGVLWDSVQADPDLRDSTTIMVLPEFGRDRNLNQRNGLDHGDNTPDLRKVAMVGAGPDFRSGRTISSEMKSIDVCPTACHLLGVESDVAKGNVMRPILAWRRATNVRWALAFLLIVAAGLLVPDRDVRAADDPEPARREDDPGCLSCHEQIEIMHPWEPLSCTGCHGGDGKARAKEDAHVQPSRPTPNDERTLPLRYDLAYRRFVNPTDLRIVDDTCGQCHADACNSLRKSLHGTTAGHLSDGLYENGVVREKDRRYAIFPVRDEDGDVPANAYRSLPAIPPPSISRPDDIGQHFADLPRKSCMVCHLYSRGLGVRGRLGQDGWYRAEGCAACHVLYEPDGFSRSRDTSIDRLEPGHPRTHELTSKIPTETCTKCHALDANIGMSFRGLAQLPPGVPGGPDVPGTTNKLSKGQFFLKDIAVCPPDVHYERGLHCIDCHGAEDAMGDGNIYGVMEDAVGISCSTCHGTYTSKATFADKRGNKLRHVRWENGIAILTGKVDGKAHVIKQVVNVLDRGHRDFNVKAARAMDPIKHARLACYACHNAWSVNFFGFHFDRNESFTQLDILSGNRTPGRVTTQEKIFASFRHYYLGVDSHGQIAPYMVGFSTTGSFHDKKGVTRLRQALPVTAAGLSGMTLIHHQLHTVRPAARHCDECHGAPGVLGLGSENFHLFRDLFVVVGDAGLTTCGFDVANPGKSVALANVALPSQPRHVALLNDRLTGRARVAYVACRDGSVQVVDLEDPVDPRRVRDVDAGDAQRVHVREGHLFVAAGREGLLIYGLDDPRRPKRLANVTTTDARGVFVDGLHAYVADGAGGLRIIDVSEPGRPALRSTVDLNGEDSRPLLANDVLVHFHAARPDIANRRRTKARNIAYVADGRTGLYVVDVTRPGEPKVIPVFGRRGMRGAFSATSLAFASNYDIGSAGGDIPSVEREYLYVVGVNAGTSNGTLLKVDVSDPATPAVAGARRTVDDPRGVRIARVYQPPFLKQFALVAGRGRGNVEICDVTARVGQIPQAGVVEGTGRVVGIDLESMPLDRMVGFDGKPLKDVSHPKSRLLTKKEIARILRVEER